MQFKQSKTEQIKDAVYVAATVVGTAATVYLVWRMAAGPDAQRQFTMAYYHKARELAKAKAEHWQGIADKYGDLYINAGLATK